MPEQVTEFVFVKEIESLRYTQSCFGTKVAKGSTQHVLRSPFAPWPHPWAPDLSTHSRAEAGLQKCAELSAHQGRARAGKTEAGQLDLPVRGW